jgi:GrpB-like predicted nucleotidyltransferase (UPF0157 family)
VRPKTLADLDFMDRLLGDPEVMRYVSGGVPQTREQTREGIVRNLETQRRRGFSVWLGVARESGEPVGDCGLYPLDRGPEVEVAYRLARPYWGKGYATEAAAAALRFGFDVVGLDEIVAVAYPENVASRRVMEKIGMRYEGTGVYYGRTMVRYVASRAPEEPVELADYDPAWPARFDKERRRIAEALGDLALAVEHVGSTAVPGLAGKPVIDVLVGLRDYPLDEAGIAAVEALGYLYRGELGIPGRQYFRRGEPPSYHLHATLHGFDFWRSHLAFRDHLRAYPDDAARYAALKRELAGRFRHNRALYTEAKAPLIEEILARAAPS